MHSKTSKKPKSLLSQKKVERVCSESELSSFCDDVLDLLKVGSVVHLKGEMGAGKSTLARELLKKLGVTQEQQGSPTFALAHEYEGKIHQKKCDLIHIDFYRIENESEIEAAGIHDYFWNRDAIVITEWLNNWEALESQLEKSKKEKMIRIEIEPESISTRRLSVFGVGE